MCPESIMQLSLWWFDSKFKSLEKFMWETCFFASVWTLWLMRNNLVFNGVLSTVGEVGEAIKTKVAMWVKVKFNIKVYSVEEFKIFLDGIRTLKV